MDLRERTDNENRHPWELSRADNILNICKSVLSDKSSVVIGDIGAGDRYFAKRLSESLKADHINAVIYAVDSEYEDTISDREDIFMLKDIAELEKNSMDCIIMMDVLEHIEDDKTFLASVLERLKAEGILVITVPAFQSLFSSHDAYLKHYRRYNFQDLHKLLYPNELEVSVSHYFYFSLSMVRWLQVKLEKNKQAEENEGIGMWKYGTDRFLTKVIKSILNIDFTCCALLNKLGIRLPGLSLLAVAAKPGKVINDIG